MKFLNINHNNNVIQVFEMKEEKNQVESLFF